MSLNDLPKVVETEVVYDGFFQVRKDRLEFSGENYSYYTLKTRPFAVMVLARTSSGQYVINREYRHPTSQILLSCPGGVQDRQESPEECAIRELKEETGYEAVHFKKIGESYPFPGITSQKTLYFLATQAKKTHEPTLERAEFIETLLLQPEELNHAIKMGQPVDGLLLTALFFNCLHQ